MHTSHSFDGETGMEDMLRAAIAAGITVTAITDHAEMNEYVHGGFDAAIEASFAEASALAQKYSPQLRVACGVEMGQATQDFSAAEAMLAKHRFDFVLGSLHNLADETDFYFWDYDAMSDTEIHGKIQDYFNELTALVKWGRFHSLAHLTYPFRFIPPERGLAGCGPWMDSVDEILRLLAQKGIALEINAGGLRSKIGETLPGTALLKRFRELGGEYITLGADAHKPADIGYGIDKGAAAARAAGFRHCAVYFGGTPEMMNL